MAEFVIQTINITSSGNHSIGDVIVSYWDSVSESITVKKNGSTITSGLDVNTGTFSRTETNYRFCDGGNQVYFSAGFPPWSFPYTSQQALNDWPSCAISEPNPDLEVFTFDIINESSATNDGQFTAGGKSTSGSIELSLQDFTYGEGNPSPHTFTGLTAGEYTVYARDLDNNIATKSVTIEFGNDYGVLYRAEWYDLQGKLNRFDIKERGYSGSITEVTTGSNPFAYNVSSSGINTFYIDSVKPSNSTIELINTSNFQFKDLFTQDDRKYTGIWYLDVGAGFVERWRGFSIPSVFSEPYITPPYPTQITFTDGLAELENLQYLEGGSDISGEEKVIKIISRILRKTGLDLPIRVGINMYSTSMNSAATDDPLDQVYIDNDTFYRGDEIYNSNLDIHYREPFDCGYILNELMKIFGARIYQSSGYWHITRPEEERETSYDYREFDYLGDYSSNGSVSPNINMDGATSTNRAVFANNSGSYSIYPGFGQISVVNELNPVNMVKNGGFFDYNLDSPWYTFNYWNYINSGGNTSIGQARLEERSFAAIDVFNGSSGRRNDFLQSSVFDVEISSSDEIDFSFQYAFDQLQDNIPFIVLKYRVKLTLSGTDYYLNELAQWETTERIGRATPTPGNGWSDYTITAKAPEGLSGKVTGTCSVRVYAYSAFGTDFGFHGIIDAVDGEAPFRAYDTTNLPEGSKFDASWDVGGQNFIYYYELQYGTEAETTPTSRAIEILRPDDYNATTNQRYWRLINSIRIPTIFDTQFVDFVGNKFFYLDDISFMVLPQGDKPPKEEVITIYSAKYNENLSVKTLIADVGQYSDGSRVTNDIYANNDYFRLSDGSPITNWTRDGVSENLTTQKILSKTLSSQFSTPTDKISGTFTTDEGATGSTYIFPFNTLINTFDNNKVYSIDGMTFNSKMNEYTLELIEIKELSSGGGGNAFSGDFNNDFGNSFDTTYN